MKAVMITLMVTTLLLAGCALQDLQKDFEIRDQTVKNKESLLQQLNTENDRLKEDQWVLLEKLKKAKLGLDDLKVELDRLIDHNKNIVSLNRGLEKNKAELKRSIKELEGLEEKRRQITDLEQQKLSASEKNRKIDKLNDDIKLHLLLGLKEKYRPVSK